MQNVRQFSLFSTPSLQMSDEPFSPFAFCFPPYLYMGRYAHKEGKIKEKVTKYFSGALFCVVKLPKWRFFVFPCLTYARTRARISLAILFFLLSHLSHTRRKKVGLGEINSDERRRKVENKLAFVVLWQHKQRLWQQYHVKTTSESHAIDWKTIYW